MKKRKTKISAARLRKLAGRPDKAALAALRAAAERGKAAAFLPLGVYYFDQIPGGEEDAANAAEADKWLRLAAERGEAEAEFRLAEICHYGLGGLAEDKAEAFNWLTRAAGRGHTEAQYHLAAAYAAGDGAARDLAAAVRWYRQAAERGHRRAMFQLALACDLAENPAEALKWYRRVAELPDYAYPYKRPETKRACPCRYGWREQAESEWRAERYQARFLLGLFHYHRRDLAEAAYWFRQAQAERWERCENLPLAERYLKKTAAELANQGAPMKKKEKPALTEVANDTPEAAALRAAAELGDPAAYLPLGLLCYDQGGAGDMTEALKWLRLAAEQGADEAEYSLAEIYWSGLGGQAENRKEAVKWYIRAAGRGHSQAQFFLAVAYATGDGAARDLAEAAYWFRQAAEQGHEAAMLRLARAYDLGEGVAADPAEADPAEAVKWYRQVAERRNLEDLGCFMEERYEASLLLGLIHFHGEGVARDLAEAAKWFRRARELEEMHGTELVLADLYLRKLAALGHG